MPCGERIPIFLGLFQSSPEWRIINHGSWFSFFVLVYEIRIKDIRLLEYIRKNEYNKEKIYWRKRK